jgi:hypothetical protein
MMASRHIKLSHIKKQQARGVHTSCAAAVAGRGVAAVVALCISRSLGVFLSKGHMSDKEEAN